MKLKTYTDIVETKASEFFAEIKLYPQLASFITAGLPVAIASYLASDMYENENPEASLIITAPTGKLMRFELIASKKGDSVAILPGFELLDAGKEFINSDEVNFDAAQIEDFAKEIVKNKQFTTCLRNAFAGKMYADGEWKDISTSDEKGLVFDDETDVSICAEAAIVAIIEVLCNNKDSNGDITYVVPGMGEFKVSPVKDGYSVSLIFDKTFKANCKSDKLAEKMAEVIND